MPLRLLISTTLLIVLSQLLACGGSGGGGPPPVIPPPAPPLPSLSIDASNAQSIAQATLSSSEFALMIADEAAFVLQKLDGTSLYTHPWNCGNGSAAYTLSDADQDGALSVGDTASGDYTDCQTVATDGTIGGQLSILVSDVDDVRGQDIVRYAGTINADALVVVRNGSNTTLNGNVDFEFSRGVFESSIAVNGAFSYRTQAQGNLNIDWQGLAISKTEFYETARYTLDVSGTIQLEDFSGSATVSSTQQFGGYLNTFPEAGIMEITANGASKLQFLPSAVQLDAAHVSVDEAGDGNFVGLPADVFWGDLGRGYLWWYELSSPSSYNIKTFDLNDFSILNRRPFFRGNLGSETASVNPEIRVQVSRTVDAASIPASVQLRQINDEWPFTPYLVDTDIEVRGALVIFRPVLQLAPGGTYAFPAEPLWISDINGNVASISEFDGSIRVSEPIISIASPEEAFGFAGNQVLLDASRSTNPSGQGISYSWEQVLGTAAAMTGASEQQAAIILPAVAGPELLRIHLISTNEFGEFDIAKTDISVFPDPSSVDVVVTRGDGVDGSFPETLYTPSNGTQTYFYNGQDVLSVENDTDYVVAVSDSANIQFRQDLELVFGLPASTPAAVGVYDVPINSDLSTPRLRVLGNEGCFGGPGRFEIFEIQIGAMNEVEKLAVDYSLQCDPGYSVTEARGHVRFMSNLPITPAQ